jgi:phosphonate degradation associated HDIG domain protein
MADRRTPMLASLDDIEQLYAERGGRSYGETVTQLEHAVQCASLAQSQGASDSLVAAALLHDVGHLFEHEAAGMSIDLRHEASGARALAGLFGEAVTAPIALHVAAKRYLCFAEPAYFDELSAASKASLALQGGPMSAAEAAEFESQPRWRDAVALRRLDDLGKDEEACGRPFADFSPLLASLLV